MFIVIEGNRRLAAVRSILSAPRDKYPPEVAARLQELPVLVFADGANRGDSEEVLRYLGVKHLFGFRDWPPTSKAMFLDKRISSKKDLTQVLRELNIKKPEAARYLIPYRLTKAAKQIFKKVDAEDFWSLAESFGRRKGSEPISSLTLTAARCGSKCSIGQSYANWCTFSMEGNGWSRTLGSCPLLREFLALPMPQGNLSGSIP